MIISTLLLGTWSFVASLLAGTIYQWNADGGKQVWNIISTER